MFRKIATILTLLLLLTLGTARLCTAQKLPEPTLAKGSSLPTTLTTTLWKGLPVVEVRLQGTRQTEFFVLSTGMGVGAIHPETAQKHQLPQTTEQVPLNLLSSTLQAPAVSTKSLFLNGAWVEGVTLGVFDVASELSSRATSTQEAPTGWIGNSILSLFQVTFDGANQQVTLESPKTPLPKSADAIQIPFTYKGGRIWVKVTVEGAKPFDAVLDTGTVGTLIPVEVGKQLSTLGQKTLTIQTKGKRGAVIQTPLPNLKVGNAELRKVTAVFLSPDSPTEYDPKFAVLGRNFLRYFRTTISYTRQKIVLVPLSAAEVGAEQ